jgi:hypothetical protein
MHQVEAFALRSCIPTSVYIRLQCMALLLTVFAVLRTQNTSYVHTVVQIYRGQYLCPYCSAYYDVLLQYSPIFS